MGEGSVGTAEREVIGEFGYSHAEVGRYIAWCPYVAEIPPLANEGEAGSPLLRQMGRRIGGIIFEAMASENLPGGIETGRTNDNINLMLVTFVIDKPGRSYTIDRTREARCVLGNESF